MIDEVFLRQYVLSTYDLICPISREFIENFTFVREFSDIYDEIRDFMCNRIITAKDVAEFSRFESEMDEMIDRYIDAQGGSVKITNSSDWRSLEQGAVAMEYESALYADSDPILRALYARYISEDPDLIGKIKNFTEDQFDDFLDLCCEHGEELSTERINHALEDMTE